jgi:lysophospholipase L1-like esterase
MRLIRTLAAVLGLVLATSAAAATTSATSSSGPYNCDGTSTVAFPVTFGFLENAHLLVTKKLVATGVVSSLAIGTDYTVSGAGGSSGTVSLVSAAKCASGYTLTIARVVPVTQPSSFSGANPVSPKAVERALDRQAQIAQQIDRKGAALQADFDAHKSAQTVRDLYQDADIEDAQRYVEEYVQTLISGNVIVPPTGEPTFLAPLLFSTTPEPGSGTPSFYRPTALTVADHEGISRSVSSGSPAFPGAVITSNLLKYSSAAGFTNAVWTKNLVTVDGSSTVTYTTGGGGGLFQTITSPGTKLRFSARLKKGTKDLIQVMAYNNTQGVKPDVHVEIALTDSLETYSILVPTNPGDSVNLYLYPHTASALHPEAAGTINCEWMMAEDVSNVTKAWPVSYVATTASPASGSFGEYVSTPWTKVVALGDSITERGGFYYGWIKQLISLKPFLPSIVNKGVSGNTLSQMWARWSADVLAQAPSHVIIAGGTNDLGNSGSTNPTATMQAMVQAMVASAKANGIVPILANVPPRYGAAGWTADQQTWLLAFNVWLSSYAAEQGIDLWDRYSALLDPVTPLVQYDSNDFIHTGLTGNMLLARGIAASVPSSPVTLAAGNGVSLAPVSATNKVTIYSDLAESIGDELVVNGAFDSAASWSPGSLWAISGGLLTHTPGSTNPTTQAIATLKWGRIYRVAYTVTGASAGSVRVSVALSGTGLGTYRSADGTYTEDLLASDNGAAIRIEPSSDFNGSLDNVSVKEIFNAIGTNSSNAGPLGIRGVGGPAAATMTIVDDSAALAAAGIAATRAVRVDGLAGGTYMQVLGATGNTNPHMLSVYARKTGSGVGGLMLSSPGWSGEESISSESYQRIARAVTPSSAGSYLGIRVDAGTSVYFVLPQLEEGTAMSPVIVTAGAPATKQVSFLAYPSANNFRVGKLSGTVEWTPATTDAGWIWSSYVDAGTATGVLYDGSSLIFRKRIGGVNYDATRALAVVAGTTYSVGWRVNYDGTTDVFLNGMKGTGNANTGTFALGPLVNVGDDGAGGGGLTGQFRDFAIYFRRLDDGAF